MTMVTVAMERGRLTRVSLGNRVKQGRMTDWVGRVGSIEENLSTSHLSYWMKGSAELRDGRDRGRAGLRWAGRESNTLFWPHSVCDAYFTFTWRYLERSWV